MRKKLVVAPRVRESAERLGTFNPDLLAALADALRALEAGREPSADDHPLRGTLTGWRACGLGDVAILDRQTGQAIYMPTRLVYHVSDDNRRVDVVAFDLHDEAYRMAQGERVSKLPPVKRRRAVKKIK